jgi:heat shock protein HspQ
MVRRKPAPDLIRGGCRFADKNVRQRKNREHVAERNMLEPAMNKMRIAKYMVGQVVKHRVFPFRGVVFDIDPVFNNTEEWYQSIPADVRPHKDQPFYHLFAENSETEYIAYVSEQNLLPDTSDEPVRHPQVAEVFVRDDKGSYRLRNTTLN